VSLFCWLVVANHRSVSNMMKIFALLDLDVYAASWTRMRIVEGFGLTSKFDFNIVLPWKVKVRFAWCCLKFRYIYQVP
jgi:hypothetical protein